MSASSNELDRTPRRERATALFTRRVKPGHELEYEALAQEMLEASQALPGQLRATMLHEADSPNYTLLYSFADQPSLRAWLDSPRRRQLLTQADQIADARLQLPPLSGLETSFTLPHRATLRPPPRWKMWLVSLLAIYPLVVTFQALLSLDQDLAAAPALGNPSAHPADADDLRGHASRHTRCPALAVTRRLAPPLRPALASTEERPPEANRSHEMVAAFCTSKASTWRRGNWGNSALERKQEKPAAPSAVPGSRQQEDPAKR